MKAPNQTVAVIVALVGIFLVARFFPVPEDPEPVKPAPVVVDCSHKWGKLGKVYYRGWNCTPMQERFCDTCGLRQEVYCLKP